jgi:hypothetical protein
VSTAATTLTRFGEKNCAITAAVVVIVAIATANTQPLRRCSGEPFVAYSATAPATSASSPAMMWMVFMASPARP